MLKVSRRYVKKSNYYQKDIKKLILHLIPEDASVLQFTPKLREILETPPYKKTVVSARQLKKIKSQKFDYIVLPYTSSGIEDIQEILKVIKVYCNEGTRIIVLSFNIFWKPLIGIAEKLKIPSTKQPNCFTDQDINNLFYLENFDKVKDGKRFLFPFNTLLISDIFNRFISPLPIIRNFALVSYHVYRPMGKERKYSVSIIIPARNESGNMEKVLDRIPSLGTKTEVIFVEGHSSDDTYDAIKKEISRYKGPIKASLYKQKGKGKGDAIRLGFEKAKNDLLMILDADLTVRPNELYKFYNAVASGKGEMVMGSRLTYPMEGEAMRMLNVMGNHFFSLCFTFLLGQPIKDTLCGTKVITKNNYQKISKNRDYFGDFDPFGDFDIIFGAAKLNLKIVEIPIRYKKRVYGETNISRFRHGLLLLQMVIVAAKKIKFI